MLAQLIAQHAAAEAAAGNWSAVATAVKALGLRATSRKCGSVETAAALAAVGVNWAAVMDVIDDDATGRFILTMLASEGVQWGHALTIPYLRSKQGAVLTSAGVDALIDLSSPLLYPNLTAADCEAAVGADQARQALVRLQQRRSDWDVIAADIRSGIESGQLADDAAVLAAVQSRLS
jgi:hypothetical protein